MADRLPKILLASRSPRRRQILESLGLSFEVSVGEDTEIEGRAEDVEKTVVRNAWSKLNHVPESKSKHQLEIACDTVVLSQGKVLGKPSNSESAEKMLESLSGKSHTVVSGLCLRYGVQKKESVVKSEVFFRAFKPPEIKNYLETKEPWDKAGAYAVQGLGALFIERIEGSYTNVMGLPVEQLLRDIETVSRIPIWNWFK